VLFPFGHGLSYTTFDYRDLVLTRNGEIVTATFKVKNTGSLAGKEIVQLYVRDLQSSVYRPDKELRGFTKLELLPGQETQVSLPLGQRAFAFFDPHSRDWVVEAGDFEILVGASSRDIRLKATLHLPAGSVSQVLPAQNQGPASGFRFTQAEFETLLGYPLPANTGAQKGSFTLNTPISELGSSYLGRLLYRITKDSIRKMMKGKEDTPSAMLMLVMADEMPLRNLLMAQSPFNHSQLKALLLLLNGHSVRGLLAFLKAAFRKTGSD
jgi:beta-glucosidase